MAQTTCKYIN